MTTEINLQYDTPIEVTKRQYDIIMNDYAGTCFGREENGKYYIKLASRGFKKIIERILNTQPR